MKKTLKFGKIDFTGNGIKNNAVEIEIEYSGRKKDSKVFSACANVWNGAKTDICASDQCLDELLPFYENDKRFCEIYRLWKAYHLNDLHPECEHQAALGWRELAKKEVTLYHWVLTSEAISKQNGVEQKALQSLKKGESFKPSPKEVFFSNLNYSLTTPEAELMGDVKKWYKPQSPLYPSDRRRHEEIKTLGWLRESEHPDGLLCRPCPVCGYRYGSGWKYFPIPKDDEAIIYKLLETGNL